MMSQTAKNRLFTFASCMGIVLVQLDVSIVNVGLHALKQAYQASVADLEWVINAYALVFAALIISSGTVVDKLGSKKAFLIGVAIFITASVLCALAPTIFWLDVMRGIQGIGAALLLPSSLTLLRLYFDDAKQRSAAIAMWAASGALALVAGPVTGGILIEYLGWKSIFLINFPLGLLSIFIMWRLAPNGVLANSKINFVSQGLIAIGLGLITFTLTEANKYGWSSLIIVSTLLLGLLSLGSFIISEKKTNNPVISHEVMSNKLVLTAASIGFLCNLVFYGAVFIFSIFFQNQLQLSVLETGIAFMPMMAVTALVNYCSKWFSLSYGIRALSLFGSVVSLLGFLAVIYIAPHATSYQLYLPMILLGSGTSFAMPVMTNLVLAKVSSNAAGSASALFNCARQMGGVTGVAVFGLLFSINGTAQMTQGLMLVASAAAIITVIWLLVGNKRLPAVRLNQLD